MVLVGTVLSQNTNWRNTRRAFDNFAPKFQNPAQLAEAHLREIEKLIRPAGLYKAKARNLREMARIIQEKYGGDLGRILEKPPDEARRELLEFPGVGYKTADCVLLFAGGRDVLPVDVHVARTAKRLGFASLKDSPERVREKLEPLVPKGRRGEAHLLLIELGRQYCRASKPLCSKCPVNDLCPKVGLD